MSMDFLQGHTVIVKSLLEHGANTSAQNNNGHIALHEALRNGINKPIHFSNISSKSFLELITFYFKSRRPF